jgi:hypothetical protein
MNLLHPQIEKKRLHAMVEPELIDAWGRAMLEGSITYTQKELTVNAGTYVFDWKRNLFECFLKYDRNS